MSENVRNFMVGITLIGALLGLALLLLFFDELHLTQRQGYEITVHLNTTGGLRAGSPVELDGIPIGSIRSIDLSTIDPTRPVEIIAVVDADRRISRHAVPTIASPLIGGSAVLRFRTPPDATLAADQLPDDGTGRIDGWHESTVDVITRTLDERLAPMAGAFAQFEELADTYTELGTHLTDLFRVQDQDEIDSGMSPNVRTLLLRFDRLIADARMTLTNADSWLTDEKLRHDVYTAIENAGALIEQAAVTVEEITAIAGRVESDATTLMQRLLPVADQLDGTLEEVRVLIARMDRGDGTVAQLLNNPDLYHSLDDAAVRLERVLVEVQLLVERISEEGVPLNIWRRPRR